MPLAIYSLALLCFAVGTAEFVIAGILPTIANYFNITANLSGYLITVYALGVVIFAPIVVILVLRFKIKHKTAILWLIVVFIIGNTICAVANNFTLLLIGRLISSITHGAGFGLGVVLAMSLVANSKKNLAIAVMFTGLTVANVVGVPLGTFIGQALGWRFTFVFILLFSVVSFIGVLLLVKQSGKQQVVSIKQELKTLQKPVVLLAFLNTAIGFAGVFLVITHIASLFTIVTQINPKYISALLLLFGVAIVLGNLFAGKKADININKFSYIFTFLFIIISILFYFASPFAIASVIIFIIWGFLAFTLPPMFQGKVVSLAQQAPNLASTFNVAAFNLAITLGSVVANTAIANNLGFQILPLFAALFSGFSLIILTIILKLQNKLSTLNI